MELQIMQEKTLGLAGSYRKQIKYWHHQGILEMEPTGQAYEGRAKEQLAVVNGGGDKRRRL